MSRKHLLLTASAAVLASSFALTAAAQEAAPGADSELRVTAVTVTATRRAESVQDVPLNIAAVGGEQIEEQGFDELADVLAYVPGINVVDRGDVGAFRSGIQHPIRIGIGVFLHLLDGNGNGPVHDREVSREAHRVLGGGVSVSSFHRRELREDLRGVVLLRVQVGDVVHVTDGGLVTALLVGLDKAVSLGSTPEVLATINSTPGIVFTGRLESAVTASRTRKVRVPPTG